jgi:4-hydroxy-tetrahydrodipicolinate reductase
MPLKKPVRVLHYGLGEIGQAIVRQVSARDGMRSVGAVDVDPAKSGRDLGDLARVGRPLKVKVSADSRKAIRSAKPDVVVLCTQTSMKEVWPQIEGILELRVPVVSTSEELVYPVRGNIRIARRIHLLAKKKKVPILATGVNPGFTMDALPIALTAICERVDAITVERVQDARVRRLAFQQKIGAGLTREQFLRNVDEGLVRHVGLAESMAMIADAMGWTLEKYTDDIQPKIATETVTSEFIAVDPGYVCGIVQDGRAYRGGREVIHLHLEAYLGAPGPYEAITIEGSPRIQQRIHGGIHGDLATAAIVVNSIPKVLEASPGLHTMRDLPLPSFGG